MTPVANRRPANPLRAAIVPALALALAAVACAALAWWLSVSATASVMTGVLVAVLVVLPVAACILVQLRRDHALRHAQAALARTTGQIQAQEQVLHPTRQDRDMLVAAIDDLPIGVAVFDRRDRLVFSNRLLDDLIPGLADAHGAPAGHLDLLRRERDLGVRPHAPLEVPAPADAASPPAAAPDHAALLQYPGDRWIQALAATSALGITVVARADVTELVRAQHRAAAANAQLVRQSTTDGLTGITNRRQFDQTLDMEWQRAARAGSCLSLLMVDIDHFKRFNDHYGHVAGDECLRRVAHLLQSCVRRAGELVARYGGEEFVILLPGSGLNQAEELAQQCLDGIAGMALPHASSPTARQVSFSIGIANVCPDASRGPATLVNAADTAMYRAKTAGRARYAIADGADWEIDKDAPRSQPGDLI